MEATRVVGVVNASPPDESRPGRPGALGRLLALPLLGLVRVYQVLLSPLMGGHCRFHPSCSRYAAEALHSHGAFRGSWLAARRLAKCHPFGSSGYDPVPPADNQPGPGPAACGDRPSAPPKGTTEDADA